MSFLKKIINHYRWKSIAKQLRKPIGKLGVKVARKMNETNEHLYNFAFSEFHKIENNQILEIGFGNGFFFDKLLSANNHINVTGIDFSKTMVHQASVKNNYWVDNNRLQIVQGDSSYMPFPENVFDIVYCINVAYFWKPALPHLNEITRVLKKGGSLFIITRTKESMNKMPFTKHGFTSYEEKEWKEFAIKSGLTFMQQIAINEPRLSINNTTVKYQSECFVFEKKKAL